MADEPLTPAQRLLLRVELIALAVAGCLVLLFEVGLRVVDVPGLTRDELLPPRIHAPDGSAVNRTTTEETMGQPHPFSGYSLKPSWVSRPGTKPRSHNSHGLRGPEVTLEKPDGTYRVVCLGGSSTYGTGPRTFAATWPARLQKYLQGLSGAVDVEVLNGGAPGWTTFESIGNLAFRMLDFDPDLVIVYHTANDAIAAVWDDPAPDNTHLRSVWPIERPSAFELLLEESMLYLTWLNLFTDQVELRSEFAYYTIVGHGREPVAKFAPDEIPPEGLENFERNLVTLVGIARAHGVEIMLGRQAWEPYEPTDDGNLITGRARARAVEVMDASLVRVAAEHGVRVVDGAAVLEAEAARQLAEGGGQDVFRGNVHLKNSGADLLAATFAKAIQEAGLIR